MLFFEIVQQKYGSGYGLRYGEGFYADSPDFLTSDARKGQFLPVRQYVRLEKK